MSGGRDKRPLRGCRLRGIWTEGRSFIGIGMGAMTLLATPVVAKVTEVSDQGFTVSQVQTVVAGGDKVWAALIAPARWWSPDHSWSGNSANLSIDPRVGGCFCESWSGGRAEHARVIQLVRGRLLRLSGALGPLQGEAVTGTLSITLTPEGRSTKITAEYVVGGHARFAFNDIAPAVDAVVGQQIERLAKLFRGVR